MGYLRGQQLALDGVSEEGRWHEQASEMRLGRDGEKKGRSTGTEFGGARVRSLSGGLSLTRGARVRWPHDD